MTTSSTKFITFGCWNEFCCDESSPMYQVIDSISRNERDVQNYFILGDNIYPDKKKDKATGIKKKVINEEQLFGGLTLLQEKLLKMVNGTPIDGSKSDSKLYLLLGNHDIEEMEKTGCDSLLNERKFSMVVEGGRFVFPEHLSIFQEINENTLVIMIDTNIYSEDDLDCYRSLGYHSDNNIKLELQNKQRSVIENELISRGKKYTNIIICGHHPLIGFKNQTVKEKGTEYGIKGGVDVCESPLYSLLLDVIKPNTLGDAEFFYLCADIHNYQKGNVSIIRNEEVMSLEQHIVGIGGAHSDDDYNGKYLDKKQKKQILKENRSKEAIQERLNEVGVDYNRPAIIDIEDVGILLEYRLETHFSDYGYLVGEINEYGKVILSAVNLGIKARDGNTFSSGGKRTRRRNKRTRRRNKRTRRR